MAIEYRTVFQNGTGEIVEKKSRFIANVKEVHTEAEANEFLTIIRKKYWDARHHCSACIIGKQGEFVHSSDDGEPSGTAGKPMLEVLRGECLCDVIVVVTRYFGGTLLGTGGLVRAYTAAAKEGIRKSGIETRKYAKQTQFVLDYQNLGKLQYILGQQGVPVINTEYGEKVRLTAALQEESRKKVLSDIRGALNDRVQAMEQEEGYVSVTEDGIRFYDANGALIGA